MADQSLTGNLYMPSDVLADDDSDSGQFMQKKNEDYEQQVNNMLATILETKRQMEATGKSMSQNILFDLQEFLKYQQKYPYLIKKTQKKFKKFNLTTSQLLKFIKIEQKFMSCNQQSQKNKFIEKIEKEEKLQQRKKSRKNLVQVHGILIRKKSYKQNPRFYH